MGSRARRRRLRSVLGAESCTWWSTTTRGMVGETVAWSKAMSTQRSPARSPRRLPAVGAASVEEVAQLLRRPDFLFGGAGGRWVGGLGNVADQIAPAHGVVECD